MILQNISSHRHYQTKEQYVYEILRTSIMLCELKPGEKMVIDTLAAELQVSTIPVRGALQRLQSEGLVEIVPHTGAVVSEISITMVEEIFMLLESLETVAFNIATRKASAEDIERLREIVNEMDKMLAKGDASHWSELNSDFHRRVAEISGMKLLIDYTSRTLDSWDRLRRWCANEISIEKLSRAQSEHHQMVRLLEARDADELSRLIRLHNRQAQQDYRILLRC